MLRVLSDALTTADDRQVTLIALLDLSSAFDWVDHELLLRRLQYNSASQTTCCAGWRRSFPAGRNRFPTTVQLYAVAPVRGRLSSLCDDIGRWRCAGCRSPGRMCCRRRCMDELKPATSQLVQDAGDVARTQEPDLHRESKKGATL